MDKKESPLDRIQKEMEIEEREVRLERTTDILNKAVELPKERELGRAFKSISGQLEEDIKEIKADAQRMFTAVQTLKSFSKQLRKKIEEPLDEAIHQFRRRNKILSTDMIQTRESVLSTIKASNKIREEQARSLGTQEDLAKVRKVRDMISRKGGKIKPEEVLEKALREGKTEETGKGSKEKPKEESKEGGGKGG